MSNGNGTEDDSHIDEASAFDLNIALTSLYLVVEVGRVQAEDGRYAIRDTIGEFPHMYSAS